MKVCCFSALCLASASAFSTPAANHNQRTTPLSAVPGNNGVSSRSAFLTSTCSAVLSTVFLPSASVAEEIEAEAKPIPSIKGCDVDSDCVSTANIKDAKGSYFPPWTFEVSPDEAFARIKGVLKSDPKYEITDVDDEARYIRAFVKRLADQDEVEFLVKGDDKVVLFRSTAKDNGSVSDFGANRKRIDDVRKKGEVFELMGGGMTADSFDGGGAASRGNSPWGQLKAFYGLQKGEGFESVLQEEDEY
mmetsp:Transcript_21972/g.47721  ORF Transcript_21972/g.47721 Transcript_21972/m.47721 type:complete len:247 (+) Transcript_21972:180-920(+)|eukprot:CAMPEP_0172310170 /NCGR_PEP_ID=MMETSP1058-20130122/11333_1 /TAXON_ID=83371 /ORGANISM="Detonula confervacea, Strain CCMP 353" /LENGTH=246 /DNA_ID=CAMNT_0013022939 /DNA_START=126 /DNA_END=866 /DNA_ORIENTATION=+